MIDNHEYDWLVFDIMHDSGPLIKTLPPVDVYYFRPANYKVYEFINIVPNGRFTNGRTHDEEQLYRMIIQTEFCPIELDVNNEACKVKFTTFAPFGQSRDHEEWEEGATVWCLHGKQTPEAMRKLLNDALLSRMKERIFATQTRVNKQMEWCNQITKAFEETNHG